MSLLQLKNVTKQFGGLTAVGDVTLTLQKDHIFGLIGPNGAGKTTMFNLITGVYKVTKGEILFEGKPIHNMAPYKIAEAGVTRTFQNIRLFKNLTAYDNILTACQYTSDYNFFDSIFRNRRFKEGEKLLRDETDELMEIMGLTARRNMVAGNLPYGLQRRLEIARALALKPKLLLLDEPAAGMNEEETIKLMELIRYVRTRFNLSVLIIEHHMDLIMNLCDHIMVLNFGKTLAEGDAAAIQSNPKVIEAYLGEEE
jgi:branched-chain amino acid transport system ATP-binding protein